MEDVKNYAESHLDHAYESLQIAKVLVERFKEDYGNETRDSDPDVKIKAYNLFLNAITMSVYNCHI